MTAAPGAAPEPHAAQEQQEMAERQDFLREIVQQDLADGRIQQVVTRFPPEPNGYLHIGHAKSICLNFGIARHYGGQCNLRMDDTNPTKEDVEYVDSITTDVRWLIDGWADHCLGLKPVGAVASVQQVSGTDDFHLPAVMPAEAASRPELAVEPFYASDYFEPLYQYALRLIEKGKAFVCDHTPTEVDQMRGAPDRPGEESLYRNRSIEENLDLFQRMRAGEFPDGARTLRAKIDMASPNVWLRDPVLYRIRHASHPTTPVTPVYLSHVRFRTRAERLHRGGHSQHLPLEFEVHRPFMSGSSRRWIYRGYIRVARVRAPERHLHHHEQAQAARLVQEGHVRGWDDPRMPNHLGMRRRGYPAEAIRAFCDRIGVAKRENMVELSC
jgi:glutaminyl-tRNA synthetase